MDTQIIVIFCLCEDMLKSLHHYEDSQRKMSDAEVMTTALVAALYFKGNFLRNKCASHQNDKKLPFDKKKPRLLAFFCRSWCDAHSSFAQAQKLQNSDTLFFVSNPSCDLELMV